MFDLSDKVIVVTGGAGLLGSVLLGGFQKAGATCINVDLRASSLTIHNQLCDITKADEIQKLINSILTEFGRIDGWVNNAYPRTDDWGIDLESISVSSWEQNVSMHLNSYFYCCQSLCKSVKKQETCSIINMASIYGFLGPDFTVYEGTEMTMPAAYSAIKGGIINLTRYFASFYGGDNIKINSVSPGGVFNNQDPLFVAQYSKKVPLKRMARAEELVGPCYFLLSDASSYITGHNLVVDGGWSVV